MAHNVAIRHKARKRFGQNFLVDPFVVDEIIGAVSPSADDHVIEIGPGHGVLTERFLQQCEQLDIIELDRDLVNLLKQRFPESDNFRIHSADALRLDTQTLQINDKKLRIVGNLPYNISTPLMFHLFNQTGCIIDMHFMLQKEVVDRMCANPGRKQYGRLSVMTQFFCQIEKLFEVPADSFRPQPKVTSAVVQLIAHSEPPVEVCDHNAFERLVAQAFSQRRKTLRNALSTLLDESTIRNLDIDPGVRAERLSLDEFARLSNAIRSA